MDFLIKAYWYQADAAKLGIKVTDAQVQKAFNTAKKQQFPTGSGFNTFLSQTGQTLPDILFRFRVNTIVQKLVAKHTTTVTPAQIQAYYNSHLIAVRHAGDAQHADRAGQDAGAGARRQEGARARVRAGTAVAKKYSTTRPRRTPAAC